MDSPKIVYKYYSNPAFCAQSEVVFTQKSPCVSSKVSTPDRPRMPPLGANSPRKSCERANHRIRTDISDNPLRIPPAGSGRYFRDEPPELPPKPAKFSHSRSNSGIFERSSSAMRHSTRSSIRSRTRSHDLEMAEIRRERYDRNAESDDGLENSRISKHRYEVIEDDFDDLIDYSPTKKRIIAVDPREVEEFNVDGPDDNEMKEIPTEIVKTVNGRTHRYAIVPSDEEVPQKRQNVTFISPIMSKKNLIATQKLHELLSTPRKLKSYASQPSVRIESNKSMDSPRVHQSTPKKISRGIAPSRSCANLATSRRSNTTSPTSPRAQQKLNYGVPESAKSDLFVRSFREKSHDRSLDERNSSRRIKDNTRKDKTTAVITPR